MREKLIELIQSAVSGCATYWAGLIADKLIAAGVIAENPVMNEERCVCCDAVIPEGTMVCPNCLVAVKVGVKDG